MAFTNSTAAKTKNNLNPILVSVVVLLFLVSAFFALEHFASKFKFNESQSFQRLARVEKFSVAKLTLTPIPKVIEGTFFDWTTPAKKPLIIHLWATWCKICREESPTFQAMADGALANGANVLGILTYDSERAARNYDFSKVKYDMGFDEEGLTAMRLKVDALPQTLVLDRGGEILRRVKGPLTEHESQTIQKLIADLKHD